tara:strand:- start:1802 stop:2692 length:891 start_codon:yes stop_codon:yes gene_type:complete
MKIEIKKYLFIKILIVFSIFLFFNILILLANNLGFKSLQQELVNHQLVKINENQTTIFLGDSSLGHAINADFWSNLSKQKTSNMALTGNFSFAGSYAFLKEILKKNKNLKTVIIVNNVYSWQENVKFSGFDYISQQKNFFLKYLNYLDKNLYEIKNFYFNLIFNKSKKDYSNLIINDFMKHGVKISEDAKIVFESKDFNKNKSHFLKKILKLCIEFNIKCIYLHGPIYEKSCNDKNIEFFNRINQELNSLKILYDKEIKCLTYDQIGDSLYHTSAKYKDYLTNIYYKKYIKLSKNY